MNLSQLRAANALMRTEELLATGNYGKYKSYVQSLPATILMNGLGQAAAMLLAAAKGNRQDPHRLLYNHLSSWLCNEKDDYSGAPYDNHQDLLRAITTEDEDHYLKAQAEALAYLEWLKKFANAYLRDDSQSDQVVEEVSA